ncbi:MULTISPECIES: hypothetical protein [Lysinibacillus]|uniref:hypothetical protein n=1 Tax=Lysinibacillus TaxID=400634 RepID=UPI00196740B8|nr:MULTISPECIES: hypothetical protein [Lysinibacillus]QSB09314.1 hypothetical protein JTI58_20260 [Lysinibacillus fusiformis]UXJ70921.1 hypothetical protein N5069_10395 [Lysinibacillus fusiformis]
MTEEKQPVVEEKLFTQRELDEIITKRLAREHKKCEKPEILKVRIEELLRELAEYADALSREVSK